MIYPAENWIHLRTTNPIESTFRRCGTGPRSPRAPILAVCLAMVFKLIESAQVRQRSVNAPQLVRAGTTFVSGKLVERPDERTPSTAA